MGPHQIPLPPNPIPIITGGIGKLGGVITGGIGSAASALNPFKYVAEGLSSILRAFETLLQAAFEKPIIPSTGTFLEPLYGESVGLTSLFKYLVVVLVVMAMIPRFRANLFQAFLVALFLGVATAGGFEFWNYLIYLRESWIHQIIQSKIFVHGGGVGLEVFDLGDGLLVIIALPIILYYLIKLLIILYVQAFGIIAVKFLTPIALLLWPTGKRGKRFVSWVFATGVVCCIAGAVGAVLVLEVSKLALKSINGSVLVSVLLFAASLRIAANLQSATWEAFKAATLVTVTGALSGRSLVGGKVSTETQQRLDVNVRSNSANAHANTMPVPVVITNNGPKKSGFKRGVEIISREGIALAAGGLAGVAAESAHQLAPVVAQGAKAVQSHQHSKRGSK